MRGSESDPGPARGPRRLRGWLIGALVIAALAVAVLAFVLPASSGPERRRTELFSDRSPWSAPIDRSQVDPNSETMIGKLIADGEPATESISSSV